MPATAPRCTRRALIFGAAAGLVRGADPGAEVWEVITEMASALGRGSDVGFLAVCDPQMPAYSTLRANVTAFVAAADIESGIDPVRNTGDDKARDIDVDWSLHIVGRSGLARVTERREVVKCRVEKRGRRWKVVALEPVAFFAPASAGMDLAHERVARLLLLD